VLAVCLITYVATSPKPSPPLSGDDHLDEFLTRLLQESRGPQTVILITGSGAGADGRMIAGFAERLATRPRESFIRASKLLAQMDWNGDGYRSRFHQPEEVIEELDRDGVSLIAMALSPKWHTWWPHEQLLLDTINRYPERLQTLYTSSDYRLYRFSPKNAPRVPEVLLQDLRQKLGQAGP